MSAPTPRTLRCANSGLYTGAAIMMLAAAIYVFCCKDALWQQLVAAGAAIITPIWAAYYALLRFTVDPGTITRRSMLGTTTISWSELTHAELQEARTHETESCTITLQAGEKNMRISSDLLPLEDVQELARELADCGLLR